MEKTYELYIKNNYGKIIACEVFETKKEAMKYIDRINTNCVVLLFYNNKLIFDGVKHFKLNLMLSSALEEQIKLNYIKSNYNSFEEFILNKIVQEE